MAGPGYVCIECGRDADSLYQQYRANIIKISHCSGCGGVVDRYVEFDGVIILLDALLHKHRAYRHLLFNSSTTSRVLAWRLLLVLVACDVYMSWAELYKEAGPSSIEWQFLAILSLVSTEWLVLIGCMVSLVLLHSKAIGYKISCTRIVQCILVSSFGKLFVIPAIVWVHNGGGVYLSLTKLFIFTSNTAALLVLLKISQVTAVVIVLLSHVTHHVTSKLLRGYLTQMDVTFW